MRLVPFRRWPVLTIVLAVAAAACTGGGESGPPGAAVSPAGIAAENAATAELLPTDAAALPEVDLAAYETLIGQLRGTPVVVNIWGSWCGPCREEAGTLADAHARYGDRVQFLGVDILDSRAAARDFMREFGWTYPSLFDPPGAVRDGLGLLGQPVTLFYDRSGELADGWTGPIPPKELDRRIEAIVKA